MSVLHQNSGGIGKSIPSALQISLDPRDFPRASPSGNLSGLGKSFGRQGWISQYLPRLGGARIQCQFSSKSIFVGLTYGIFSAKFLGPKIRLCQFILVFWMYARKVRGLVRGGGVLGAIRQLVKCSLPPPTPHLPMPLCFLRKTLWENFLRGNINLALISKEKIVAMVGSEPYKLWHRPYCVNLI